MKFESKTVHAGDRRKAGEYIPVTTPIYTASSYFYDSMDQLDRVFGREEAGPSYARYDNPTTSALEALMTELEGGHGAFACSSGMMAIHLALLAALVDRPKRIVAGNVLYGATTHMLMTIFGALGVETEFVDLCDLTALEKAVIRRIRRLRCSSKPSPIRCCVFLKWTKSPRSRGAPTLP